MASAEIPQSSWPSPPGTPNQNSAQHPTSEPPISAPVAHGQNLPTASSSSSSRRPRRPAPTLNVVLPPPNRETAARTKATWIRWKNMEIQTHLAIAMNPNTEPPRVLSSLREAHRLATDFSARSQEQYRKSMEPTCRNPADPNFLAHLQKPCESIVIISHNDISLRAKFPKILPWHLTLAVALAQFLDVKVTGMPQRENPQRAVVFPFYGDAMGSRVAAGAFVLLFNQVKGLVESKRKKGSEGEKWALEVVLRFERGAKVVRGVLEEPKERQKVVVEKHQDKKTGAEVEMGGDGLNEQGERN